MEKKRKRWDKDSALEELKKNIEYLGYIPTSKKYGELKFLPSYRWFSDNYGSFNNAIGEIIFDKAIIKSSKQLTKEDLIEKLQEFNIQNGRAPFEKELKNPGVAVYYSRFNTKSWNKILEVAELKTNWQSYNVEYGKKAMINLFNKYGRIPTREEINNQSDMPNSVWYWRHYGSTEEACLKFELISEILTNKQRIDIAIDELIKLADKLHKTPTVDEYEKIKHKGFVRRDLERHLDMKYNDICRKYISEYKLNANLDITDEEIINSIHRMYNEYGRILSKNEYLKLEYSYDANTFRRRLNMSYGQCLEGLGYKMYGSTTIQKTDEELLNDFDNLFKKLKRIPLTEELISDNNISTYKIYISRFKSLKIVCDLLNIDWDLYNNRNSLGKILYDQNNEMCKSIKELMISNYFIENSIEYEKEGLYSDSLEQETNRKRSRRFDWSIKYKDKTYFIEYFGLYFPSSNSKMCKTYIKKAKKKIKDLYKAGLMDKCIFIFPNSIDFADNELFEASFTDFLYNKYNIKIDIKMIA